jgi:hypothetical protein
MQMQRRIRLYLITKRNYLIALDSLYDKYYSDVVDEAEKAAKGQKGKKSPQRSSSKSPTKKDPVLGVLKNMPKAELKPLFVLKYWRLRIKTYHEDYKAYTISLKNHVRVHPDVAALLVLDHKR